MPYVDDPPDTPRYEEGQQPYDQLVGMRVGALVGGVVGVVAAIPSGGAAWWLIPIGAAVGGFAGHRLARRR